MQTAIREIVQPESWILDPSLKLYLPLWKRDGISFMSDDAYGHLLTRSGSTSSFWRLNGHFFNGSDDDENAGQPAALFSANGTWVCWVKAAALTFQGLFSTDAAGGNAGDAAFVIDSGTSKFRFWLHDGATEPSIFSDGGVVADGSTWFHAAVTFGDGGMLMYIDGGLQADTNVGHVGGTAANQDMMIGAYRPNGTNPLLGIMGEVLILNRALSAAEITDHYNKTKWRYQ